MLPIKIRKTSASSENDPLAQAAKNGNVDLVKELLCQKKDHNIKDDKGWYPIHQAACNGHTDCVKQFLNVAKQAGLDPEVMWPSVAKKGVKRSPLFLAAQGGHLATVKMLMDSCDQSSDMIYEAAWATMNLDNIGNPGVFRFLLKILPQSEINRTMECFGRKSLLHKAVKESHLDIIDDILARGINLELKDKYNTTALHRVFTLENEEEVEELAMKFIDAGCDMNAPGEMNYTPLCQAAQGGCVEIVKYMVEHGADPNIPCNGWNYTHTGDNVLYVTPICRATHPDSETFNYLITVTDKDVLARNGYESPVPYAVVQNMSDSLQLLLDAGYPADGTLPGSVPRNNFYACGDKFLENFKMPLMGLDYKIHNGNYNEVFSILFKAGVRVTSGIANPVFIIKTFESKDPDSIETLRIFIRAGVFEFAFGSGKKFNTFTEELLSSWRIARDWMAVQILDEKISIIIQVLPAFEIWRNQTELSYRNIMPSLVQLSRYFIRSHLMKVHSSLTNVDKLPLPHDIIQYLQFSQL